MHVLSFLAAYILQSGGICVAGGLFAFLTIVGVVTRLASGTKTAKNVVLYEDISLFGLVFGNIAYLFGNNMPIGTISLLIYGLGAGVHIISPVSFLLLKRFR